MGFRVWPKRYIISGLSVLAAALMWTATAHAASNSVVPCEQIGRDLQSLEVPVDTLSIEPADHVPIDADSIDERPAPSDSATPVLDLAPRVTSILHDVFGTAIEDLTQDEPVHPPSLPLAERDAETADAEPADTEIERGDPPRFQQQMLRKDI